MKGGVASYLVGAGVLLALAGCGRGIFTGERASWRHQAEVECMKSGAVKLGAGVARIEPIEGPGMCGADFPLKVTVLGEGAAAIGYGDDLRPPGSIPNASQMPNWPVNEPRYTPPAPVGRVDSQPMPPQSPPPNMRWVPGPSPAVRAAPMGSVGRPIELNPTGIAPGVTPSAAPLPDDIPDDAVLSNRAIRRSVTNARQSISHRNGLRRFTSHRSVAHRRSVLHERRKWSPLHLQP